MAALAPAADFLQGGGVAGLLGVEEALEGVHAGGRGRRGNKYQLLTHTQTSDRALPLAGGGLLIGIGAGGRTGSASAGLQGGFVLAPVGHKLIHQALEAGIVQALVQVHQLVHHHVVEAARGLLG